MGTLKLLLARSAGLHWRGYTARASGIGVNGQSKQKAPGSRGATPALRSEDPGGCPGRAGLTIKAGPGGRNHAFFPGLLPEASLPVVCLFLCFSLGCSIRKLPSVVQCGAPPAPTWGHWAYFPLHSRPFPWPAPHYPHHHCFWNGEKQEPLHGQLSPALGTTWPCPPGPLAAVAPPLLSLAQCPPLSPSSRSPLAAGSHRSSASSMG